MPRLSIPKAQSLKPTFTLIGLVILLAACTIGWKNLQNASASVNGWNAGHIIDDGVFINSSTMSVSRIQSFLNAQVPNCDTWGAQPSEFGGGTRRQWAEAHGYSAPFTCLRNYSQGGKSAAQIIYNAAQDFNINPQVLLVLLQKEQGLVKDTWPLSIQYRSATGYGCPDNAACDSDYYGFTNQVRWAARMFHAIMTDSPTWYTPYVLGNNYIQYNPDASCGGSTVNIRNRATKALYNYTPYQPNKGSLNAGWGTASCGSYGNRNFYLYFTGWFGSTRGSAFTSFAQPRYMQLAEDTHKVDAITGNAIDGLLPQGSVIKFTTKTAYPVNGEPCMRTENDTKNNLLKCIPWSSLKELSITPTPISETLLRITADASKEDISTGNRVQSLTKDQQISFSGTFTRGSTLLYITKHDMDKGIRRGIPSTQVSSQTAAYSSITPKLMTTSIDTVKKIPTTNSDTDSVMPRNAIRFYNSRVFKNGQWYYRSEADGNNAFDRAIPASSLHDVSYADFTKPRWMQAKNTTHYVSSLANTTSGNTINKGTQLKLVSKIQLDGVWYFRTESDSNSSIDKLIPASEVNEIPFLPFLYPRSLQLSVDSKKYVPSQESPYGSTFPSGMRRYFTSKIEINGVWYFRTDGDARAKANSGFKAIDLE